MGVNSHGDLLRASQSTLAHPGPNDPRVSIAALFSIISQSSESPDFTQSRCHHDAGYS